MMQYENGTKHILRKILKKNRYNKVLLFTDKNSYLVSGAKDYIEAETGACSVTVVDDFTINPKSEDVRRIITEQQLDSFDAIAAIGGGSVIDVAKLVNFFGSTSYDIAEYLAEPKKEDISLKPFIAIPTTSGTGSEATHFAVLYYKGEKYSVAHAKLKPCYAVLNPALTLKIPKYISAATSFDAFSQAVESLWATGADRTSKKYAVKALKKIIPAIEKCVNQPDFKSRRDMMLGAYYAGEAINIAKTTGAHAFSYFFTSKYNVPHGHAVAFFLGRFLVYNSQLDDDNCNHSSGAEYVKKQIAQICKLLKVKTAEEARDKIENIMNNIALYRDIRECGFNPDNKSDVDALKQSINLERLGNNPRKVDNISQLLN